MDAAQGGTLAALDPRRPLGNVVVATDLSPGAMCAVERALLLPLGPGSTITLLHVPEGGARRHVDAITSELQAMARAACTPEVEARQVRVHAAVESGFPEQQIMARARGEHADLIVMGRHGGHVVRGLLVGSTLGRVVREAAVPVLVVAGRPAGAHRRPLAALEVDDSGAGMLDCLLRVASREVARVELVHVQPFVGGVDTPRVLERANHAGLEAWRRAGITLEWRQDYGIPADMILKIAAELSADLIGMGTHGLRGAARFLLGSTAEKVLSAASCDVLVARAGS